MTGPRAIGVAVLAVALTAGSATAETRTAQYGALFCRTLPPLKLLIAAMIARDEAATADLDDCTSLKPGVRLDVLGEVADLGAGQSIIRIHFHGNGSSLDGYTLNNDVEPVV